MNPTPMSALVVGSGMDPTGVIGVEAAASSAQDRLDVVLPVTPRISCWFVPLLSAVVTTYPKWVF